MAACPVWTADAARTGDTVGMTASPVPEPGRWLVEQRPDGMRVTVRVNDDDTLGASGFRVAGLADAIDRLVAETTPIC